jgi:hypothetical protein
MLGLRFSRTTHKVQHLPLSHGAIFAHRFGAVEPTTGMATRRFPPPWTVEETDACFIVKDHAGMSLAYVYFEDEQGRRAAASCSPGTRRGGSPPTLPSCRSCCSGDQRREGGVGFHRPSVP